MEHLKSEKYPGVNGEEFEIRVMDHHSKIVCSIDLIIEDNGLEKSWNIDRKDYQIGSDVEEIIGEAKRHIQGISIARRYTEQVEAPLPL